MGSPQLLMLSGIQGPPRILRHQGVARQSLGRPRDVRQPDERPLHPVSSARRDFTHTGCRNHAITPQASSDISTQFSTRGGFIIEKTIGPLSTGHLELKNRNPDDNPKVTFNYFKEPKDLRRCVAGMKTIEKVVESKAFSKFRYPFISMEALLNMTSSFPMNLLPKHQNDSKSLEQFCRDTVMTIWHYHGGCQVGRVVDRDYRVIGVDALRVVDGSTFIYSPGTNPQATVMMLGRYMGVKIQSERLSLHKTENGG
ncbi:uncharacterized protein A4U43_C10F12110 [Asparagus officinalis]|uniref:Glucose-methanol-choline oxidoreductase C-terminal domain-containing protein n=1 Tax=Asparagus officinalis TaxID=4686 RepID=A0A5P1E5K2_ASPOF|nr:uncharacterized protein A4U43_C10F12110 [Asparagus officinalis]